jgi:ribosome-binding protein aMBF1 (putative translation factor)
MSETLSAEYCRSCARRVAKPGTVPSYVATCRCVVPVPYLIVTDSGKPKPVRPRGPRVKQEDKIKAAAVEAAKAPPVKKLLPIQGQIAVLLRSALESRKLVREEAAKQIGIHDNSLREIMRGTRWPSEDTMTKVCTWLGCRLAIVSKD